MTANMFRIGDYVYVETSPSAPYQIRRIEELIKTSNGNVEAKVMCFFRRRDIPSNLLSVTCTYSKHSALEDDGDMEVCGVGAPPTTPTPHTPSPHYRLLVSPPSATASPRHSCVGPISSKVPISNNVNTTSRKELTYAEDDPFSSSEHFNSKNILINSNSHNNGDSNGSLSSSALNSVSIHSQRELDIQKGMLRLTEDERHQLRHRELFLTRQIETLPASQIRGKCSVTLLNEAENLASYISKHDTFFYSLVYDPQAKTLLADKGEIRIGSDYQAVITKRLKRGESDNRVCLDLEQHIWSPLNPMSDEQVDQFLVMARSVGTFARALDCSSSVKQPSLHMSAAAASRDVTLLEAMSLLHGQDYDMSRALSQLVPGSAPLLCRDQMEEWAASESNLFEEALEKYGKDFNDIRQDFLPWKTLKNIVEYYYMWKTTDRYVQQKRVKAAEAECKLKQVIVPHSKANLHAATNGKPSIFNGTSGISVCEGCSCEASGQWHVWGPPTKQSKLCDSCWLYWRRLGGLKRASRSSKEDEEAGVRPVVKTRNAFYLHTSSVVRIMRRLAGVSLRRQKMARNPMQLINVASVRQQCMGRLRGRALEGMMPWFETRVKATGQGSAGTGTLREVSLKCGQRDTSTPPWLVITAKRRLPPAQKSKLASGGLKRKYQQETNGMIMEAATLPNKRLKETKSSDYPLNQYKLSQLGVHTPAGLTVTPINGGRTQHPQPPPPYNSSHTVSPHPARLPVSTVVTSINSVASLPTTAVLPPMTSVVITASLPTTPVAKHSVMHTPTTTQQFHQSGLSRAKAAAVGRVTGRPRIISFTDAPDDVYFYATNTTKTERRCLSAAEVRRAARRPWRSLRLTVAARLVVARPKAGTVVSAT